MSKLKLEIKVIGPVETNCYFLMNEETGEMLIVDPAEEPQTIVQKVQRMQGTPVAILLTHGHFDHIMAAKAISERYDIPIYAHEAEQVLLEDPRLNLSAGMGESISMSADYYIKEGPLKLAGFDIEVIHTPGHTKGGVCYYFKEEGILISGDTLFAESVGRTDFPNSSTREMIDSIHKLFRTLPDEVEVYPGHMQMTTIEHEKRYNPCA